MNKSLAWIGAAAGIVGAILLSLNVGISGWGYAFFIGSSISLSIWAFNEKQNHQLIMQLVFSVINLNGCIQWLT